MKKFLFYGLFLFPLLGCEAAQEPQEYKNFEGDLKTEIVALKTVQCVFKLDINEILAVDWKTNGSESLGDTRNFENRLGLLSGFDLSLLPGEEQDSSPEGGSSIIYVASYADCDTTSVIVNHLAEKHLRIRLNPPIEPVDAKIYVNLAKSQGYEINDAAFDTYP